MTARPSRQPFASTLVIRASRILSISDKVLWEDFRAFDKGDADGAYISAESLSERWGGNLTAATIEVYRARLRKWELLGRIWRPAGGWGWIALLPERCLPEAVRKRLAKPVCRGPEALQLGGFLDRHILTIDPEAAPGESDRDSKRDRTPVRNGIESGFETDPVARRASAPVGGKGGLSLSSVPECDSTLSPQTSTNTEDREVPKEPKARRERGKPGRLKDMVSEVMDGIERQRRGTGT